MMRPSTLRRSLESAGAASIWSGPDRSNRTDWMINGMIKAHSIQR
jgi:hypothetical protein